nr:MAG TPA: leucine rich repeat protein [Caudoviricetes sp.]
MKLRKPFYGTICEYSPDGIKTAHEHRINPIGTVFNGNTKIKDFSSFSFFTKIKDNVSFENCKNLVRIVLPQDCTLQQVMFSNCIHLKEVIFPVKMKSSPYLYETFSKCISLKVLDFPETYTGVIESSTFRNVTAILIFRSKKVVEFRKLYGWDFYYNGNAIYVLDDLVEQYKHAYGWKDKAELIKPLSEYHG